MERSQRRFTLGDAMILVAASASALALMLIPLGPGNTAFEALHDLFERPKGGWVIGEVLVSMVEFTTWAIVPFVATWTVAALAFQLRRPRLSRRRLGRQPGAMVVLLGTISVGLATAWGVVVALAFDRDPEHYFFFSATLGSILAGAMIIGGWIAMAVGGHWRPEPTWLDRFGRLLGVSWIVIGSAGIFSIVDLF